MPLLDEGPEILGPELFGSSGRRRHGASVKTRDGVPQKGPSEGAISLPDVAWLHSPIHGLGTGW